MKNPTTAYVKRTQKDYTISFKLQVVNAIENGALTASQAVEPCGISSRSTDTN
ncbi:hypothetical protein [Nonlabens sp.]|uniref:hypothetical protein n=1 Tax=Nonlabens sp. TaxID=1888209 RepID=UPI0025F4E621|nr:hypothetical protein [Nonlabens sp.]